MLSVTKVASDFATFFLSHLSCRVGLVGQEPFFGSILGSKTSQRLSFKKRCFCFTRKSLSSH